MVMWNTIMSLDSQKNRHIVKIFGEIMYYHIFIMSFGGRNSGELIFEKVNMNFDRNRQNDKSNDHFSFKLL